MEADGVFNREGDGIGELSGGDSSGNAAGELWSLDQVRTVCRPFRATRFSLLTNTARRTNAVSKAKISRVRECLAHFIF